MTHFSPKGSRFGANVVHIYGCKIGVEDLVEVLMKYKMSMLNAQLAECKLPEGFLSNKQHLCILMFIFKIQCHVLSSQVNVHIHPSDSHRVAKDLDTSNKLASIVADAINF